VRVPARLEIIFHYTVYRYMPKKTKKSYKPFTKAYKRLKKKKYVVPVSKNRLFSFPSNRIVQMRFSQQYTLDSVPDPNGTDENFIFANCLYKPDHSDETNRNALGYTNWGNFYEKYTILSATIRVQFVSTQCWLSLRIVCISLKVKLTLCSASGSACSGCITSQVSFSDK